MFSCKACAEKDKRILELKEQIVYLRSLVYPQNFEDSDLPAAVTAPTPSPETYDQELTKLQEQQSAEQEEIRRERDRLLSGTY